MRILITCCGRAGSQYVARLLSACGLFTSHERVYRPDLEPQYPERYQLEIQDRWNGRDAWGGRPWEACVSWLAAPFLGTLPKDVVAFHQLRDPLKVVRCWASHDLLENARRDVGVFIHAVLPQCNHGSRLERAIQYVLGWTKMIQQHDLLCHRVEDFDAARLTAVLRRAELYDFMPHATNAFGELGQDATVGHCPLDMHMRLTWDDIVKESGGKELRELAQHYGYET